jgi:hypothetical protein
MDTVDKSKDLWEFKNQKLRKCLPADLIPQAPDSFDDCRGFLLSLAVIYNDLKGLTIFNDTLPDIYRKPLDEEISAHAGEYGGLRLQLLRILLSTLHEFLVFLEKNEEIYKSEFIQKILERCSKETQRIWFALIEVASGNSPHNLKEIAELAEQLEQIRNNVGYHYQTRKRIIAGFRRFFYGTTNVTPGAKKWIFWSGIKTDRLGTRFYYADAALNGYLLESLEKPDGPFDLMALIAKAINELLLEYHSNLPSR